MAILLNMDNFLYDLSDSSYDINTHKYIGVPIQEHEIANLFSESALTPNKLFQYVTIGEETFKPIDKINNFRLISDENIEPSIEALKTNTAMLAMKGERIIDDTMTLFINYFNIKNSGTIKMVLSFNCGTTWYTYANGFTVLPLTIPQKDFSFLSESEKADWETAKETILLQGFDCSILDTISFKSIPLSSIRFAFVLQQLQYPDGINAYTLLSLLEENRKEKPHYKRVPKSNYNHEIKNSQITITPQIESMQMYLNALACMIASPSNIAGDRVETPILSLNYNKDDQKAVLEWNAVERADYYKLFINNNCMNDNYRSTSFEFPIEEMKRYEFCVRAFPDGSNASLLPSNYSNTQILAFPKYLYTTGGYVAVHKSGTPYKLKAGE